MNHGWEYKRLGDVCKVTMGQSPESSSYNNTGDGMPFFQGCSDFGTMFPKVTKYCSAPTRIAETNDILFSVRAPIGTMNFANCKCCIGRGLCSISPKSDNQRYVYYALICSLNKIIEKGTGSTFKAVGKDVMNGHYILLPSKEIQNRIASELDKINELIEVKRSQLADLDMLAQSLFYEMFGDPITNPTGWKISKVSEIFETGSGGTPSKSVDEFWSSEDIPWIGSNMCQNKILYETDGKFISKLGLENSSAKLLEPDTILIALVGATIGKVALLKIPTSTNQNIGFIKPDKNIINPIFLFYTIQGLYSLFLEIGNGKFKMANLSFIRNLPIIIPPTSLQNEFSMRIEAIEEQKNCIDSSITDLQTLLASRMDYWFND